MGSEVSPETMETDHLHNAIRYHQRKVDWHAERVAELRRELAARRRQHRGPKPMPIGYAAVWQGGKLVHFSGSIDEYERDHR